MLSGIDSVPIKVDNIRPTTEFLAASAASAEGFIFGSIAITQIIRGLEWIRLKWSGSPMIHGLHFASPLSTKTALGNIGAHDIIASHTCIVL